MSAPQDGGTADNNPFTLEELGWDDAFAAAFAPFAAQGCIPGRVGVRHKGQYGILTPRGELAARIKGHLRYEAQSWAELPVVGDWVALNKREGETMWHIHGMVPRRTCLSRKVKGTRTTSQALAANVTTALVVMGLTEDFNLRRLERFLVLVHESGVRPVVVLNKADLLDRKLLRASTDEVKEIAGDADVIALSALEGKNTKAIEPYMGLGETVILLGSSGAGKSTLVNALLGEERQPTNETRRDGKGRHTTTQRELMRMPTGALVIDSPGIREIQLWEGEEGFSEAFADIDELAAQCKFRDCRHQNEPGCAVTAAIEEGTLEAGRLDSWRALKLEIARTAMREQGLGDRRKRAFRPDAPKKRR